MSAKGNVTDGEVKSDEQDTRELIKLPQIDIRQHGKINSTIRMKKRSSPGRRSVFCIKPCIFSVFDRS